MKIDNKDISFLNELIKNDDKMDHTLREELNMISLYVDDTKTKNFSKEKMEDKQFCSYLKIYSKLRRITF